jgi:hypothetical protein
MSLSLPNTTAQMITPGDSISSRGSYYNSRWLSRSQQFAFGFFQQSNNGFVVGIWLVGETENTLLWTANQDDPSVTSTAELQLTMNGTIILTDQQGQEKVIVNANTGA